MWGKCRASHAEHCIKLKSLYHRTDLGLLGLPAFVQCSHLVHTCWPLSHAPTCLQVRREGLTLPQAGMLARCNGARVGARHQHSFSLQQFRELVDKVRD